MNWPFRRRSMPARVRREVIRPTNGLAPMLDGRPLSVREVDALAARFADEVEHFSALFFGDPDAMRIEAERRARREAGLRELGDYSRQFPIKLRPMSDPSQPWPGVVAPADSDVPTGGDQS